MSGGDGGTASGGGRSRHWRELRRRVWTGLTGLRGLRSGAGGVLCAGVGATLLLLLAAVVSATAAVGADDRLDRERVVRRAIAANDRTVLESRLAQAQGLDRARLELALVEVSLASAREDRGTVMERIVALRRPLLAADDPRAALWGLDQAEMMLLARPSLDATHLFARAGTLSKAETAALRATLDECDRLLAQSLPEIDHPLIELDRSVRRPILIALAGAFRIDLAVLAGLAAPRLDVPKDLLARSTELPPPARDAIRLAIARIATARGESGEEAIQAMRRDRESAIPALAAGEALLAIAAAESGGLGDARSAIARLESGTARGDLVTRLLIADASHRIEVMRSLAGSRDADPIGAWVRLHDRVDEPQRIALRGSLLRRVAERSEPFRNDDLDRQPILRLVAFADDLRVANPEGLEAALRVRANDLREPGRRLARFEWARTLAQLRRYEQSAEVFRSFATDFSDDPLALEALDLALEIDRELALDAAPRSPRATALRSTLDLAIGRYALDPRRSAWRVEAAELALRAGDPSRAAELAANVPDGGRVGVDARLVEIAAWLAIGDAAALERSGLLLERIPPESLEGDRQARRHALSGRHRLARGEAEAALRDANAAMAVPLASDATLASAVATSLRAQAAMGLAVDVPVAAERLGGTIHGPLVDFAGEALARLEVLRDEGRIDEYALLGPRLLRAAAERLHLDRRSGAALDPALVAAALLAAGEAESAIDPARDAFALNPNDSFTALRYVEALRASSLLQTEESIRAARRDDAARIARDLRGRLPEGTPAWWGAELALVHLLADDPSTRESAVARVNRARIVDPELGGPRYRPWFEAVVGTPARGP